ncbi:MAG: hypothetical protein ABIU87_11720 [Ornithinibacter sp.]
MNEIVLSLVSVAFGALVSGGVGYTLGVRRERDAERRIREREAALALVKPLRELQRLLRSHGRDSVAKEEAASAFLAWAQAYDDHGRRLPLQWRRMNRSVRDAAGTVFGGVSLIHLRPDIKHFDLGEPDEMWQDFADDYIAASILIWGDSSREPSKQVLGYDDWLVKTDRREPLSKRRSQLASG